MPAASRCGPIPSQYQGQTDALHALRRSKSTAAAASYHHPFRSLPPPPSARCRSRRQPTREPPQSRPQRCSSSSRLLGCVAMVSSRERLRTRLPGPARLGLLPSQDRRRARARASRAPDFKAETLVPGPPLGAAQHLDPRPRPHRTHWRPGHPGSGAVAPRRGPTSDSPSPPAKISIFAGSDQGAGVVKMNSDPAQEVLPAAGPAAYWRGAGGREGLRAVLEALPREPSPSASRSGGRRVPGFRALPETRPESREGRREAPTSSAVLRKQPAREATFHNNRPRSPFDSGN